MELIDEQKQINCMMCMEKEYCNDKIKEFCQGTFFLGKR